MIMRNTIKKILKEENEWDWVKESEPTSKSDIANKLTVFRNFGYYIHSEEKNLLINFIHSLALSSTQLDNFIKSLYAFGETCYEGGVDSGVHAGWSDGNRDGYNEGYNEGYGDAKHEFGDESETKYKEGYGEGLEKGYDEGYDEGRDEGYQKGYEEGSEKTYYRAFEEGRAYESGLEVEDMERRESGFDPSEYDEDYNENY